MDPSRSNGQGPPQPPSDGSGNQDGRRPGYLPLVQNPYLGPLQQNQQTPAHPTASFYNQHHQQYHQQHQLYQHHQHYPLPQYHQYSSQPVYPYPSIPGHGVIMTNSSEQHNGQGQSGSAAPGQGPPGQVFNGGPSPQFMPPGSSSSHSDPNQMIAAGHAPQPPHPPPTLTTQYDLPPATAPTNPSSGTGGIASTPEASYYDLTQNRSGRNSVEVPTPSSSVATPAESISYMSNLNLRNLASQREQETGKGKTSSEPFQPSAQQALATYEERTRYMGDWNRRAQELIAQGHGVKKDKSSSESFQPSAQQPPQPVANPQDRSGQNSVDAPSPYASLATNEERLRYSSDLNRRSQELLAQGYRVKKDKRLSKPSQPSSAQQPPQPVGNPEYASLPNNFPVPTQSAPPAPPTQTLNANSKRRAQDAVDERPEKRQTPSEPPTPPEPQSMPVPQWSERHRQGLRTCASGRPATIPDRPGSPILPWDAEPDRLPEADLARLRRNPPDWVVEPDPSQFMSKTWKRLSWSEAMEQIRQLILEVTAGRVFIKFWQFRQLCDAIEIFVARSDRRSLTSDELKELVHIRYVDIIETIVMEGKDPDYDMYTVRSWEGSNFSVDEMNKSVRLSFKERHRLAFTGGI